MKYRFSILVLFAVLLVAPETRAQWSPDGLVLSNGGGYPAIAPDGSGGAIVAWSAYNSQSAAWELSVQRVGASGAMLWSPDGVVLGPGLPGFCNAVAASDGLGGVFVAWMDWRLADQADIYVTRVKADSTRVTAFGGKPVCTAADYQSQVRIIPDGANGAIIVWTDERSGGLDEDGDADIYALRVTSTCDPAPGWPVDGRVICRAPNDQLSPQITTDGQGGAIVAWEDYRSEVAGGGVRVRRVTSAADTLWAANGRLLCGAQNGPRFTQWYWGTVGGSAIVSDGAGGAIVVWEDWRNYYFNERDIYAARVTSTGSPAWSTNGNPVCVADGEQVAASITSIGAAYGGGAMIVWKDGRIGVGNDRVYVQKIRANGNTAFAANGIACSPYINSEVNPVIAPDGQGGAILGWTMYDPVMQRDRPYAQRILGNSHLVFPADGVAVGLGYADDPQPILVSSTSGAAIFAWADGSVNANFFPLLATGVGDAPALAHLQVRENAPNPFSVSTRVDVHVDRSTRIEVSVFDVAGRRVRQLTTQSSGESWTTIDFDGRNDGGLLLPSGVYFYRVSAAGESIARKMMIVR